MTIDEVLIDMPGKIVVGIDEVGRGPWAGPLVVGAVILQAPIEGLRDSKLLRKTVRTALAHQVMSEAVGWSTGWVSAEEIDTLGLTAATTLAIERALAAIDTYDYIIIDGSINYLPASPKAFNLIKADMAIPAVSAASIVAKHARDEYMVEQASTYPNHGFERHVGYGTAVHRRALIEHGITPLHRRSFKPVQLLLDGAV